MNTKKIIKSFLDTFKVEERAGGQKFLNRIHNNEKYDDMFREMHGTDMLPDDFRYNVIYSILNSMLDFDIDWTAIKDKETLREFFEDYENEIIDGLIPVYNNDKLNWLSFNFNRAAYVDDAKEQGLISINAVLFDQINAGIYLEIQNIYNNIINVFGDYIEKSIEGNNI